MTLAIEKASCPREFLVGCAHMFNCIAIWLTVLMWLGWATPVLAQVGVVADVKATLVAQGQTFTTNCDAFEITRRVAWQLRDQGARLIGKNPTQNGCDFQGRRYSHDAIAFPDGWRDILHSAGPPANLNEPAWDLTGTDQNAPLYAPFDLGPTISPGSILPVASGPIVQPEPTLGLETLILLELRQHEAAEAAERQEAQVFRQEVRSVWNAVGRPIVSFTAKYIVPAVTAFLAGRALAN